MHLSWLRFICLAAVAPPAAPVSSAAAPPATAFAFDLLEAPAEPSTAASTLALAADVQQRRRLLQAHQLTGLSTLALMAGTVVLGQLNYNDMYTQHGGHTGHFAPYHRVLAYTTTAAFLATASLSLWAPVPFAKKTQGWDNLRIHEAAVILASVGMASQITLGFITARQADAGNPRRLGDYAKVHQVLGYSTLACFSAAALVWVF